MMQVVEKETSEMFLFNIFLGLALVFVAKLNKVADQKVLVSLAVAPLVLMTIVGVVGVNAQVSYKFSIPAIVALSAYMYVQKMLPQESYIAIGTLLVYFSYHISRQL